MRIFLASVLVGCSALAAAPEAAAQDTVAQAALMERIRVLEQRLEDMERRDRAREAAQTRGRPRTNGATAAAAPPPPVRAADAPTTNVAAAPAPTREQASSRASARSEPTAGTALSPAAQASAVGRVGEAASEVPQEAFIFRDQAVTLRPGQFEAALDVQYLRNRRLLISDRMVAGNAALRAGVYDGVELGITLPFFHSVRTLENFGGVSDRELTNVGDVAIQANIRGWGERENLPGGIFNLAVIAPTGPSPFVTPPTGLSENIPIDPLRLYQSRGAWAVRGGMQFFKTVDPIILFAGFAYEYAFATERDGVSFQPGARLAYNAGMSFAMSEKSTLGLTFLGGYTSRLRANDFAYRPTAQEQAQLRLSLVQRLGTSLWVEPGLAIGLVSDSPSYQVGLGLRYRF